MPKVAVMGRYLHVPENSRFVLQDSSITALETRAVVFLDRDGVIVEDAHFIKDPAQIRIMPGAVQALRALQSKFYIIVVTNQSGIARGLLTEEDLLKIHTELVRRLAIEGAVLDALYYCPHLPEATVETYQVECNCRKPKPGMLEQALSDWGIDMACSFMVGDTLRDIEAGRAVGVRGFLLRNRRALLSGEQSFAPDLAQAAHLILEESCSKNASGQ